MECEHWRLAVVDGYEVSNMGNVRSLSRSVRSRGGSRIIVGRLLTPFIAKKTGYLQVDLSQKRYSVHRLVALAWCGGSFDGAVVDHINGDRLDNRAVNLRWVTQAENNRASYALGRAPTFKGMFSASHPTAKPVVSRCLETGRVKTWASAMDAVRAGFDSSGIAHCCAGRIRSHKGHQWRHGVAWSEPHPDERMKA